MAQKGAVLPIIISPKERLTEIMFRCHKKVSVLVKREGWNVNW
jgi:hypothetical protein